MSNFGFVKNNILRDNLDVAFIHILTLIPLSESSNYSQIEKSSFRKTIIIYTASIIEALLYYLIKEKCTEADLTLYAWEIVNPKTLYEVDSKHKIVGGDYLHKSSLLKEDKMNLNTIMKILHDKNMVIEALLDRVDKVRILRNEQHLSTQNQIKEYTKSDLQFVFDVARDVKKIVQA